VIVLDMGELVAFDTRTGDLRWRTSGSIDATLPAPGSDTLLSQSAGGPGSLVSIAALDPSSGLERWTRDLGTTSSGAAAAGRNLVVFRTTTYRAIDLSTGLPRWSFDTLTRAD
jgi:outer membrane protein assembly factor BamB